MAAHRDELPVQVWRNNAWRHGQALQRWRRCQILYVVFPLLMLFIFVPSRLHRTHDTLTINSLDTRSDQGWHVAAAQVPISRFVDAAANSGMLELFAGVTWMPVFLQTVVASAAAGMFRATLMPLDCIKTELQVQPAHQYSASFHFFRHRVIVGFVAGVSLLGCSKPLTPPHGSCFLFQGSWPQGGAAPPRPCRS